MVAPFRDTALLLPLVFDKSPGSRASPRRRSEVRHWPAARKRCTQPGRLPASTHARRGLYLPTYSVP
jgi:hypothetical protein